MTYRAAQFRSRIAEIGRASARLVPALALTLATGGCALHVHRDYSPPADFHYQPPRAANPVFDYRSAGPITLSEPFAHTRYDDILHLSFPSTGHTGSPENRVEGQYFRSREPGAKKLLIVLPIWGTSTYPPSKISSGYARHSRGDAQVIWIYGMTPLFPWYDLKATKTEEEFMAAARDSAQRYVTVVKDMRRLIDWAATREEIDSSRIAFIGFSMSALTTATLLGNDSRIDAAVLMMGAADLADVFTSCGDKVAAVRRHVMTDFGWSLQRYHDFFAELFGPADPVRYPGHYNPDKILMIDAMYDDCMPQSARSALWNVTGHPERITLLYKHRTAFYSLTPLGLNFTRRKIYRFLDRALTTANGG